MKVSDTIVATTHKSVIMRNKVVRLRFRITEQENARLVQFGDDLYYLHGGYGGAFPKVEQALEGCEVGDEATVALAPEEGYGRHDPALIMELPASEFGEQMPECGETVEGQLPDGQSMMFTATAVGADKIVLDGNHPYAGKHLLFQFEVLEIRESSAAERSAGFAFDGMFS